MKVLKMRIKLLCGIMTEINERKIEKTMIDDKVIISMNYDETNPRSIEAYAQKLIGKTFRQICDEDDYSGDSIVVEDTNYNENHENKKRKGVLGEIIYASHGMMFHIVNRIVHTHAPLRYYVAHVQV